MTETVKQELDFLEWTKKLSEIINITHVCLLDKRKMRESDYVALEALHDMWWDGIIPLYKTVADMTDSSSYQSDLFSDNTSDNTK